MHMDTLRNAIQSNYKAYPIDREAGLFGVPLYETYVLLHYDGHSDICSGGGHSQPIPDQSGLGLCAGVPCRWLAVYPQRGQLDCACCRGMRTGSDSGGAFPTRGSPGFFPGNCDRSENSCSLFRRFVKKTLDKCPPLCYNRRRFVRAVCECSSMVESQPSKLVAWVRFPSLAPYAPLAQLDRATAF